MYCHIFFFLAKSGKTQLRLAETEKYAHVTFFFNGGVEEPNVDEARLLVNSPKDVATYDLKPEMSAPEVGMDLVEAIKSDKYDVIVINFANPVTCRTHLQSKALCLLKSIREDELQQAFLSIYNRLQCNQKTILEPLVDDLLGLRHLQEQKYKKRLALGEDIQHLAKQKHNLTRIHTLGYIEEPQFIERSAAIEQQIRERKQQLSRNDMSNTSEKILQKTRLIQKKLSSTPPLELFDESVFKELVKKVLISNTAIQFELINGMKLSESRAAT